MMVRNLGAALLLLTVQSVPVTAQDRSVRAKADQDARIQSAADEILAHSEFRSLRHRETSRETPAWLQWVEDFLGWMFPDVQPASRGLSEAWGLFAYAIAAIAIALIVGLIVRAILLHAQEYRATDDWAPPEISDVLAPDSPPGLISSDKYEQRARELAARGDYRAALGQLVLGAMSWVERCGLIRYRRGLTNRNYLRAIGKRDVQREALEILVHYFELVYFGRRPATEQWFTTSLEAYENAFREEVTAAHLAS